ncbi:MAG: DUF6338 family protein [Chloroflexota bacterium]
MNVALEIQQIILFFIFIAPGFFFSRTYLPFRPTQYYKQRSIFEQTTLALVGSAVIHALLLSLVTLVVLIIRSLTGQVLILSEVLALNRPLEDMSLARLSVYLLSALGYLFLSLIIARRGGVLFGKGAGVFGRTGPWWIRLSRLILGENLPENVLFWPVVLQAEALKKGIFPPPVIVRLRNGDTFEGVLQEMKLVGDEEDTIELAISNVAYYGSPDQEHQPRLRHHVVLLQSKDILWISRLDSRSEAETVPMERINKP